MKKGGGSRKGSNFEREICKKLSLWWSNNTRDDLFWRTAGSGGRATNRTKKGQRTEGAYGDIAATDPTAKMLLDLCCFELKRGYGQWCVMDLIDRKAGAKSCTLAQFWEQAVTSAEQSGAKYPIVIAKRDQKQAVIVFPRKMLLSVASVIGPCRLPSIQANITGQSITIMTLDNWMEYMDSSAFRTVFL